MTQPDPGHPDGHHAIQMLDGEALESVCRDYGVHPGFHDIWGQYHVADPELRRGLLQVLRARSDGQPGARADVVVPNLEPCVVVYEGAPVTIGVQMREERQPGDADLRWSLLREDGVRLTGTVSFPDPRGGARITGCEGARMYRRAGQDRPGIASSWVFDLGSALPAGYHKFCLSAEVALPLPAEPDPVTLCQIIVTPARCHPAAVVSRADGTQRRLWGVSVQLYALRSTRNWGIGDFTDLKFAIDALGALGADAIGINPLHAICTLDPGLGSPYSPASRQFLNTLYIDIEALPEFQGCAAARELVCTAEFAARVQRARRSEQVDYDGVAKLKLEALDLLYANFRDLHLASGSPRANSFHRFRQQAGRPLRLHALFEALQAFLATEAGGPAQVSGWPAWPVVYRDPDSVEVRQFEQTHADRVRFHEYLQWTANEQLQAAVQRGRTAGLRLGLYLDLALGNDGGGPEVWAAQSDFAQGVSVGAPPDDLSPGGQDWGITVFNPQNLATARFASFIRVLRAQMQAAGALRIDHVMGLMRQYWILQTEQGKQGGYVSFPFHELLGIVVLESVRNECVVIGEDLGTVPDEVRSTLADRGVLSYRVLYFEKHWHQDGSFKAPQEYPQQALAVATTHDLPTLNGYWQGRDLEARASIGERPGGFPDAAIRERLFNEREADRYRLHRVLSEQGLNPGDGEFRHSGRPPDALSMAVCRFLARTPCALAMVQIEDVLGQIEQANLPGTTVEHANWCRKIELPVEDWPAHQGLREHAAVMAADRGV